jgi:MFS family permease
MGFVTIGTGMATVLAPVLGGLVFARAGYTAVFAMAFGFIGLDLVLRLIMIEKVDAEKWEALAAETDIELSAREVAADPNKVVGERMGESVGEGGVVIPETEGETVLVTIPTVMPAFKLLGTPAFLATLWGTVVLGSMLTGLDSVSTSFAIVVLITNQFLN